MRNLWAHVAAVVFLSLLVPSTADAFNPSGTTVIIPIIGRFPGVLGSQWRTDVFLGNRSSVGKTVTATFYVAGSSPLQRDISLGVQSSVTLSDIVLNTFGLLNASGQLVLQSSNTSAFEARARIYNAGNAAGEFGQNVPGLGPVSLSTQASLYGLSGMSGNRVNIGVANPTSSSVDVTMRVMDRDGNTLHYEVVTAQSHQTVQINDIFARFGIAPQTDIQVDFNAVSTIVDSIYGYASEVRGDTGDAIFIIGTSPNT